MKSADPLDAFDRAIGEGIGREVLTAVYVVDLEPSNDLTPAAGELMMLNRLLIVPGIEHAMRNQFVLSRAEAQRVYGAAKESEIPGIP